MKNEFYKRLITSIIILPISFLIIIKGEIYFNLFLIFCFCITLLEWFNMKVKKFYFYIGLIFFIFSFLSAFIIRNIFENGLFLFLLLIIISSSTDTGGYIFGKLFKGPKLTKISPNKTYSGAIGGLLLSLLFVQVYIYVCKYFFDFKIFLNFQTIILIITISIVNQLGDLIISYFKRSSNIKDTGKLIPGHGGLLDRIDGLLFIIPFYYLIN